MSLLDPLLNGGDSAALKTTGAPVDVSGSAPPNPGDVLKAVDATHAEWAPDGGDSGGTAVALETTGAPVDVSGAAPPVAGQVLTAISATGAAWRVPGLKYDSAIKFWTGSASGEATIGPGTWGFVSQPVSPTGPVIINVVSSLEAPPIDSRFALYVGSTVTATVEVHLIGTSQIMRPDGTLGTTATLLPRAWYEWILYHEDGAAIWGLVANTAGVARSIAVTGGAPVALPTAAPTVGQVLRALSATATEWALPSVSPPSQADIAALQPKCWWRADNVTLSTGASVASIIDNGSFGKPFAQAVVADQATRVVDANGRAYLQFDGVSDHYIAGVELDWVFAHGPACTYVLIVDKNVVGTAGGYYLCTGGAGSPDVGFSLIDTFTSATAQGLSFVISAGVTDQFVVFQTNSTPRAGRQVHVVRTNGNEVGGTAAGATWSSPVASIRYNGRLVSQGARNLTQGFSGAPPSRQLYMGRRSSLITGYLPWRVYEVMLFDRTISDAEALKIEAYAASRYSISGAS